MDPINDPASTAQKSGFKTSELAVTIAGILAVVIPAAAELVPRDSLMATILGVVGLVAAYVGGRTAVKMSGNKQAAAVAGLRVPIELRPPSP